MSDAATLERHPHARAVVECALNDVYNQLKLVGDLDDFVEVVTDTAREWARECYQHPEGS